MNRTQLVITVLYSISVLISVVVLVLLLRSTRARHRGTVEERRLAGFENRWAVVVATFLVVLLAATIFQTPYGDTKQVKNAQHVNVTAQQFAWNIQPSAVRAGKPVEFNFRSLDVQHGFGVYRKHKLLFQIQVPAAGQAQRVVHTFDHPGTYEILCLEFCGFQHHLMRATFRVS